MHVRCLLDDADAFGRWVTHIRDGGTRADDNLTRRSRSSPRLGSGREQRGGYRHDGALTRRRQCEHDQGRCDRRRRHRGRAHPGLPRLRRCDIGVVAVADVVAETAQRRAAELRRRRVHRLSADDLSRQTSTPSISACRITSMPTPSSRRLTRANTSLVREAALPRRCSRPEHGATGCQCGWRDVDVRSQPALSARGGQGKAAAGAKAFSARSTRFALLTASTTTSRPAEHGLARERLPPVVAAS